MVENEDYSTEENELILSTAQGAAGCRICDKTLTAADKLSFLAAGLCKRCANAVWED